MHMGVTTLAAALPDSEESAVQPGISLHHLPEPLLGTLKIVEYVGRGGYGEVHRGYWTAPGKDSISVAIKCLKISNVELGPDMGGEVLRR
ncbi:hypothetical protein FRC01_003285, partial [Tulasnella sp. 417]